MNGKDPMKYVNDCLRRIEKLSNAGIDVIMVFDGSPPPGKANEEEARKKYDILYIDAARRTSTRGKS